MTAAVDPARAGRAAELAVRAVDDLMTWEAQAPRADLTVQDTARIARLLRQAAAELDGAAFRQVSAHGYELTSAGRAAVEEECDRDTATSRLVVVQGGHS